MPTTYVSCPACSQRLSLEVEVLRAQMQCPRCGKGFVPIEVIPPSLTLPAMPAVQRGAAPAPAATPAPAAKPSPLAGQARTIVMEKPGKPAAAPAPVTAAAPATAPAPATATAPAAAPATAPAAAPATAPATAPAAAPATAPAAAPATAPATAPAPAQPSRPGVAATVTMEPGAAARPRPSRRASSIVMIKAQSRATTIEIAMLASSLEQAARARGRRAIGYGQVIAIASSVTGLALIALALSGATAVRVIAGVIGALALTAMLAAAAAYGLTRWRPQQAPRAEPELSPDGVALYSAVTVKPSLATVSRATRIALGALALLVTGVAVSSTWLVAEATDTGRRSEQAPSTTLSPEQEAAIPMDQRADHLLRRDGHTPVSGGVLHVPPSFRSADGAYDLVMHFHGNTQLVQESVDAANINALVYIVNLGLGSGPYEDRYSVPGVFDEAIDRIQAAIEKRGLKGPRLRRVALSSWSAGYGAIAKIIDVQKNQERVDALLMLDGLHAAYLDEKNKKDPDPRRLQPFIRFAKAAAEGKKLFTMTHSRIEPREYASAEETADVLLVEVGGKRIERREAPPKVSLPATVGVWSREAERWLEQTTEAQSGGFHVRGYVGQTPEHHMAHLVQMSVTVLPELAERWK